MKDRVVKIIKIIERNNLDAVALIAGPNLAYITGGNFFLMERPTILIISKNFRPVAILPHIEVDSFKALNFDAEIISWKDSEGYDEAYKIASNMIGEVKTIGVEGQRMRVFELDIMKKAFPNSDLVNKHKDIVSMRLCKDETEIQNLKKAIKISEDALKETLSIVKEGMSENEIAQELIIRQYKLGAHAMAFNPIVLIGENSALPHGHPGDKKIKDGDTLLIDFGCVYNGYNSDFTRTYFFKSVSDNHRKMYEVVKNANELGKNTVKNNVSLHDVDDKVTGFLESSIYKNFIAHRTGHGLGMDVHEDPYVTRGNSQILEPGMVITIEPGLYDVGNLGVRIEDNVLVTENGHESLTALSRELTII